MNLDEFEKNNGDTLSHNEGSAVLSDALSLKQKIHQRKGKQRKLKIILGFGILLIVALSTAVGYSQYKLFLLSRDEKLAERAPGQVSLKTGEEVVKALSRHILLPPGIPQIAEVQEAEKLRETQAFFKNVEQGDIVVVYETTIFVYRPSKDIVIASGDISGVGQLKP
jgi:hypothetical protein